MVSIAKIYFFAGRPFNRWSVVTRKSGAKSTGPLATEAWFSSERPIPAAKIATSLAVRSSPSPLCSGPKLRGPSQWPRRRGAEAPSWPACRPCHDMCRRSRQTWEMLPALRFRTSERRRPVSTSVSVIARSRRPSGVSGMTRSIREFGLVDPIIARREGRAVIGGHQRLLAARRLGLIEVPVIFLDLSLLIRPRLLNLALNKNQPETGIRGFWPGSWRNSMRLKTLT